MVTKSDIKAIFNELADIFNNDIMPATEWCDSNLSAILLDIKTQSGELTEGEIDAVASDLFALTSYAEDLKNHAAKLEALADNYSNML